MMSPSTDQEVEKSKKDFRHEIGEFFIKHANLLVSLAGKYNQIVDIIAGDVPHQIVSDISNVSDKLIILFLALIEKLDDDFEIKERRLYDEFKYKKKLKLSEIAEQQELAMADVKNRISLSVFTVNKEAARLLVAAKELGITGSPLARLEYLSALTLKQELATFDQY